jgi:hypothetical protein
VLSFKNGKGTSAQSLAGNTTCPRSIEVAPLLFSHEQWQQCLQSSTNDNPCSRSTALIVVQSLHIFQEHIIVASFLFLVHGISFQPFLLWTTFRSSSIKCCSERKKSRHWTLTEQNSPYRSLFAALPVRNRRGDKRVSDSLVSLPVKTTCDSTRRQWWCCMFLCATKITWLLESFYQPTNNRNNIGRLTWCCEDCRKNWTSYEEGKHWSFCHGF